MLVVADHQQLLVLGLEQTDADGQMERHHPELQSAWKAPVERIDQEDHDEVDVEDEDGHEGEIDLAHPDDRMVSVGPQIGAGDEKNDGVGEDEDEQGDAVAIGVRFGPVVTSWIAVLYHGGASQDGD